MWAALRSDLKEFVSTVAEDTSTVLTKIDADLDGDEEEGEEGQYEAATSSEQQEGDEIDDDQREALLSSSSSKNTDKMSPTTSKKNHSPTFVDTEGNVIAAAGNFASTGIIASPADEAARLASHEETYLEPLQVDSDEDFVELKDFLSTFQIDAKTEEIAQLLQDHWEIQQHFENLVPTLVKYEDFWQRYYFRCDEERIARKWDMEQEQNRQARAAAFSGGLMSVRSLFGGALSSVMAVSSGTSRDQHDDCDDNDDNNENEQPNRTATGSTFGLSLFGASGRPPFVMNTAVDESFDDQPTTPTADDDEAEEEELGWDDEEEDEEGNNNNTNDDDDDEDQVEEIEFKDDAKEQLQKLLAQAISERDSLHETVELQRNEIATLKINGVGSKDLEQLKMELFEKNSELAALKASLEDTHDHEDDGTSRSSASQKDAAKAALQERELERLSNELSERECELLELKHQLHEAKVELEKLSAELESTKTALEEARVSNTELQSKIVSLDEALEAAVATVAPEPTVTSSAESSQLAATEQELQAAQTLSEQLYMRVEELSLQLENSNTKVAELEHQLNHLKADKVIVPILDNVVVAPPPPASSTKDAPPVEEEGEVNVVSPDSSTSTTVKVALPPPSEAVVPPAIRTRGKNDEEDDWGDDWGDDDEN